MIDQEIKVFTKSKKLKNPTLQKPSVALFCGATGTGKTNMMLNYLIALQDANEFQRALFVSSNKVDPMLDNLGEDVKVTNDPDELAEFIKEIKQTPKNLIPELPSIIVFDDCQESPIIKIKNNSVLNQFVLSHRHYNIWLVFCVQTLRNSVSAAIRKMSSLIFAFPPRNDLEMKALIEDIPVNKDKLKVAFDLVKADQHTPLYINMQEAKPRLYKGFKDEITDFS